LPLPDLGQRWVQATEQQTTRVLGGLAVTDENQHERTVPVGQVPGSASDAGCSTTATTRLAMNLADRTT
jgi:hypothetical protein